MNNLPLYRMNDAELLVELKRSQTDLDDGMLTESEYRERIELITSLLHTS